MKWNKETFKEYWAGDKAFDFWFGEWKAGKYRREFEKMVGVLEGIDWKYLVEIGCGVGKNIEILRDRFRERIFIGTDINEKFLDEAEKRGIEVYNCDTEKLVVPKYAEVILSYEHLQHLHPLAFDSAVEYIKRSGAKYIVLYEGYESITGDVMKAGEGGRWKHRYLSKFKDVVYKKEENGYLTLVAKL